MHVNKIKVLIKVYGIWKSGNKKDQIVNLKNVNKIQGF